MNRLKELRNRQGLTLKELGSKLNMLDSRLSQYENDKREPKLETWQVLADYFNVSVPYLQGAYSKEDLFKLLKDGIEETSFSDFDNSFEENYNPAFKYFMITTKKVTTKTIDEFAQNIQSMDFIKKEYGFVMKDLSIKPLMNNAEYANFYEKENIKKLLLNAIDTRISKLLSKNDNLSQMALNYYTLGVLNDNEHTPAENKKMIEILTQNLNPNNN